MESLLDGLSQLADLLVWPYIGIFVLLSYFIKDAVSNLLTKAFKIKWFTVYTVIIIAALVAIPFILYTEYPWVNIALSYTVGTSLHELIFVRLEKLIKG